MYNTKNSHYSCVSSTASQPLLGIKVGRSNKIKYQIQKLDVRTCVHRIRKTFQYWEEKKQKQDNCAGNLFTIYLINESQMRLRFGFDSKFEHCQIGIDSWYLLAHAFTKHILISISKRNNNNQFGIYIAAVEH